MYSKIERLLNEKGISAYRMCKDTGISRSLVSQWKSGSFSPKHDKLETLAEYFGVPVSFFYEDEPVYDVAAGNGRLNEGYESGSSSEEDSMLVRICGDSMYPTLHDGDVVRVIPASKTVESELTIVKINGDEATCKHVQIEDTGIWLRGENADAYTDKFYSVQEVLTLPVQVIGKAVEIVSRRLI